MVEISFNIPGTKVFDQPLGIDKRKSLRELKVKIGKLLDILAEEIKICKNMISGEFKTLDASIDDCGIFDGCTIYIPLSRSLLFKPIISIFLAAAMVKCRSITIT